MRPFALPDPSGLFRGRYTISGCAALTFQAGIHAHGRWEEMLHAGRALHDAVSCFARETDRVRRRGTRRGVR